MLHTKSNPANKLSSKCFYTTKKIAKQVYIEQIEDTPKNKCVICKQLQFGKNMRSISKYMQKVYVELDENEKNIYPKKNMCILQKSREYADKFRRLTRQTSRHGQDPAPP